MNKKRSPNNLLKDFVVDVERKFAFYCSKMDHAQFSLLSAWFAVCSLHTSSPKQIVTP